MRVCVCVCVRTYIYVFVCWYKYVIILGIDHEPSHISVFVCLDDYPLQSARPF
jgi:hypothetical protein